MTAVGSGSGVTSIGVSPGLFTGISVGACCTTPDGADDGIAVGTKIGVAAASGRAVGIRAAGSLVGATVIWVADFTVASAFPSVKATVGGRFLSV